MKEKICRLIILEHATKNFNIKLEYRLFISLNIHGSEGTVYMNHHYGAPSFLQKKIVACNTHKNM